MQVNSARIETINNDERPGAPLAPWTYRNPELFELEYEALFLRRWQFIGHVNDIPESGDYITGNIGRDSVIVIRDKSRTIRGFLNVCRHRASRVLEGSGSCRGVIRCPYHGWTYELDGSLMAIPQQENFPDTDKSQYGLHTVQVDVFHGMVFVRVKGDGPSVAEQFAHTAHFFAEYDVANYEQISTPVEEIWDVNWKVIWDNYLENYHIPIGHPSLFRLLKENGEWDELTSGINYGVFVMRDKPSRVENERLYQEQLHNADHRLPDALKGKWVQFGYAPNLGIDLYPEMLDFFQILPLGPEKTLVREMFYGHKNPTPEELELRRLNRLINDPVNDEDRQLCERVQQGIRTDGYEPGPLALAESCIFNFHELIRQEIPVATLVKEPPRGSVATENLALDAAASE
jgi:phenylpropionate dioxygenase-like ring-hydroxylating dioxygenase large terminal subunit